MGRGTGRMVFFHCDNLCKCSGLSKSTLLRAFTKSKGVTPYRYLQAVRIDKAKKLLEQGCTPIDARWCSNAGVIISIAPFFTAVLSHIFMKTEEKLKAQFLVGFFVAMAGICLKSHLSGNRCVSSLLFEKY